jgi:solute carrier family 25 carnitine/acylcarnitine transporter 20/29
MDTSPALPLHNIDGVPLTALDCSENTYSYQTITNSVIAGYAAGVCGVAIGHPMDSLKVFLQTEAPGKDVNRMTPSVSKAAPKGVAHMSTFAAPIKARDLSLRALYAGVSGPLVTVGLVQSANFCMYDSFRRILHRRDHPFASDVDYMQHDSIWNVAISSMAAGSLLSFVTSPLLVLKTKQQVMTWTFSTAMRDTLKRRNRPAALNFYVGFGPHFLSETIGRGVYFASYERLKRDMAGPDEPATLLQRMMAAGASGVLCWSVIFPLDVLRNRLYAKAIVVDAGSAWEMAKSMYRDGALKPFYRGFGITVLRAGPVSAAVLPVYDTTLEWLNCRTSSL